MSKNKSNKKGTSLIPQFVADKPRNTTYLNKTIAVVDSWYTDSNKTNVFLSLRLLQDSFQCFSDWTKQEMSIFWDFNRKIHNISWELLMQQAGKGQSKVGYAPTPINRDLYPVASFIDQLDPNIQLLELRLNDKIRVHGFRDRPIFYICYLDRNHEICK